ncbi:MAG: hypothetical protein ABI844_00690 [Saprospiraceae bacterium]
MEENFSGDLIPIGKVIKTISYKGEILVESYAGFDSTWEELVKCIIKVKGIWAPFFIESKSDSKNHEVLLKFKEYGDDKSAREIMLEEIFVFNSEIKGNEFLQEDDIHDWIGFLVKDEEYGEIGLVQGVEELPGQDLLQITFQGRIVSIPLVEELIVELDPEHKIVVVNLPAGLLDL